MVAPEQQLQTRTEICAAFQGPFTRARRAIGTAAASKKVVVSKRPRSSDSSDKPSASSDSKPRSAATNSNKRPRSPQHEMLSTAGRALRRLTKGRQGASSNSSGIRTHTPDLQDNPRAGMRPKRPSTTAHGSSSTATAVQEKSPSLTDSCAASFQVVPSISPASSQQDGHGAVELAALAHANQARAEPFSLGVQWDAYHTNPTQDTPGYPRGYWHSQPSPFAALASTPGVWQEQQQQLETQQQQPGGQKQQQKDSSADAAAWGYDALHMAYV